MRAGARAAEAQDKDAEAVCTEQGADSTEATAKPEMFLRCEGFVQMPTLYSNFKDIQ